MCEVYTNSQSVASWRGAGFCVLPLPENGKQCFVKEWPRLSQQELWADVPANYNIGIRLGGPMGTCVLDGDNEYSVHSIASLLRGQCMPFVCTETATPGHVHFWMNVTGAPSGESWRSLLPDVGKGEFRFGSGAQCVAPHSIVNGRQYKFADASKSPRDIANLRCVSFNHLAALFLSKDTLARLEGAHEKPTHVNGLPVQLLHRDIPQTCYTMLAELQGAEPGEPVGKYRTRSEAEFSIVLSCIRAGWDYDETAQLFAAYLPGHYRDCKDWRYLQVAWDNAIDMFAGTPTRQALAAVIADMPHSWPGRGGALEATCYQALLASAYAADKRESFCCSVREVCEVAGAGIHGAYNALDRLQAAGLVRRTGFDANYGTSGWALLGELHKGTSESVSYDTMRSPTASELWGMLGRSSMLVYEGMHESEPKIAQNLANLTGKHKSTVGRALAKLAKHGLAVETGAGWIRGSRPLAEVIIEFDCAGRAMLRRQVHQQQREAYRKRNAVRTPLQNSRSSE